MISVTCSPLLFKHKRILCRVFSMTFSKISGVFLQISQMMLFFNSWGVLSILMVTFSLRYPHRKKSGGIKSGNRDAYETSPKHEIKRPGKVALSIVMVSLAVYGVAPSCWNHKFCMSKSSSCGNKYSCIICLQLKNNIIEEINRITPDILEKVMENTVRRIRLCLNNNGEHLKDIIFK